MNEVSVEIAGQNYPALSYTDQNKGSQ